LAENRGKIPLLLYLFGIWVEDRNEKIRIIIVARADKADIVPAIQRGEIQRDENQRNEKELPFGLETRLPV